MKKFLLIAIISLSLFTACDENKSQKKQEEKVFTYEISDTATIYETKNSRILVIQDVDNGGPAQHIDLEGYYVTWIDCTGDGVAELVLSKYPLRGHFKYADQLNPSGESGFSQKIPDKYLPYQLRIFSTKSPVIEYHNSYTLGASEGARSNIKRDPNVEKVSYDIKVLADLYGTGRPVPCSVKVKFNLTRKNKNSNWVLDKSSRKALLNYYYTLGTRKGDPFKFSSDTKDHNGQPISLKLPDKYFAKKTYDKSKKFDYNLFRKLLKNTLRARMIRERSNPKKK